MKRSGPRHVGDLFDSSGLTRLRDEAAGRRDLAASVRAALPAEEAAHVVSARLDTDGCLVVGMDSAAWAARLRYARASLLERPLRVRVGAPGESAGSQAGPGRPGPG